MRHRIRRKVEFLAQYAAIAAVFAAGLALIVLAYSGGDSKAEPRATAQAQASPVSSAAPRDSVLGDKVRVKYDRIRDTTYATARLGSMTLMESFVGDMRGSLAKSSTGPSLVIYGSDGSPAHFLIDGRDGQAARVERTGEIGIYVMDWG